MTYHILTIFPDIFGSYFNESILNRAQRNNLVKIKIYNLRDWAGDKHKTVDDAPYGGGAGMVMKADIIWRAIKDIKLKVKGKKLKIVLFSARGKTWNQAMAKKYSKLDNIIMICGRYEGVDERAKKFVDEEISTGEYILTGGEIPAMIVVDSVSRLLPGVLGNGKSLLEESFNMKSGAPHSVAPAFREKQKEKCCLPILEYPQYTRPEILEIYGKKYRVPKVLLSGNHKLINEWRAGKCRTK